MAEPKLPAEYAYGLVFADALGWPSYQITVTAKNDAKNPVDLFATVRLAAENRGNRRGHVAWCRTGSRTPQRWNESVHYDRLHAHRL